MSVREVAAVLGVRPATIYKLCKQGALQHVYVSNSIRVSEAALAKYLTGRSSTVSAEPVPAHERGAQS